MNRQTQHETMPTLLITGGAGFIGGHTAEMAIHKGWKVRVLDDLSTGLKTKANGLKALGAEIIIGDIRDGETVNAAVLGCDAVVHLAAQTSVQLSVENPENNDSVNINGTDNIIQIANIVNVQRIIFASSAAVYGDCEALPLVEESAGIR